LAASLIDVGEYAEAIRHLKDVTKREADNIDALIDLGIAYSAQGFYEEAQRAFAQAQEVDPKEVLAPYHLAALFAAWERPEDAVRHIETALTLDPERVRVWVDNDRMFDALRGHPDFARLLRQ